MAALSRRDAFKTGAVLAMGAGSIGAGASESCATAVETTGEHTWGHTMAFGDEYFRNVMPIFENIRRSEMELIGELSTRMARVIKGGGNVWYQAKQGHMPRMEFDMANKGNPGLMQSNSEWDDTDYDKMRRGDVLVTNYVNENVKSARESGVYVVAVTVCYQDAPETPRGFVVENPLGLFQRDVSDVIVESHTPYEQGLVRCPQIPEMTICPSSANPLTALFWMFQAEVANRWAHPETTGCAKAAEYLDTLIARVAQGFKAGRSAIFECAAEAARRIGAGAHYHVTSEHRGVEIEATGTASGPMMTNAFRKEMKAGDVHLAATIEPDAGRIIEEAAKAVESGQYVVAIGPAGSAKLRELSDVFIDNCCPEGGGGVEVPGIDGKVGTIGGIVNNVLAWVFTAQMTDEMVRRGWVPWYWMGFFQQGGSRYDDAVRPLFLKQGF